MQGCEGHEDLLQKNNGVHCRAVKLTAAVHCNENINLLRLFCPSSREELNSQYKYKRQNEGFLGNASYAEHLRQMGFLNRNNNYNVTCK